MTRKSRQPIKTYGIQQTENKNITVDKLPEFSRANKYIGEYNVYIKDNEVPDSTRCTIYAHSVKTGNGELKNNISVVKGGIAKFEDLRFIGKSGRGTRFDVYFKFDSLPEIVVSYKHAIKVTVDGPRPPRTIKADINSNNGSSIVSSPTTLSSSLCKRKLEMTHSIDSSGDEFDKRIVSTTIISKMSKLEEKSRRESVSSSKSPESSCPNSPQSLFNYSPEYFSSHFNNLLADNNINTSPAFTSHYNINNNTSYSPLDMNQFYSCLDTMNFYASKLNLNEYNSEMFITYFWSAVFYYINQQQINTH